MILRAIIGAQAKGPVETLYQETSSLSISYVISSRRMIYLKTILDKSNEEVVKKVYLAMKENPIKNDWYHLLKSDFEKINIVLNEEQILQTDVLTYKKNIKTFVWNAFSNELKEKQAKHIKVKHIDYGHRRTPQKYLLSPNFNNEMVSLLYNLRCQSVNEFRDNFHTMHGQAPLCKHCDLHIDSQELSLSCGKVRENMTTTELLELNSVKYEDIFGNEEQQLKITKVFQWILRVRKALSVPAAGLPGLHNSGPD